MRLSLTSPNGLLYNKTDEIKPNGSFCPRNIIICSNGLPGTEIYMIINNATDFGETLRKQRKAKGYTQKYISEFTGFSISFISDLENGKSTIELGKAIYLANMLGLDIEINARGNQ